MMPSIQARDISTTKPLGSFPIDKFLGELLD